MKTAFPIACLYLLAASFASAADRPNIVWITAEDMSPTLGCYGDAYASTPHIDSLAKQSVRYTHAFATGPVCSPSRACLINGCIATTQGAHQMRSEFPLPESMSGFPALLKKAGYYTTNNVKTDYNSAAAEQIIAASWDENSPTADWRNRKPGQPFFCIFNLMVSHQSRTMVWPYEQFEKEVQSELSPAEQHDPKTAPVPPYYPDTPLVRKTIARFYDCVCVMDKQTGAILKQLEEDGLADETIVFFYSDHGSGMPRHKRVLYDSGMHVPLMVRFPEKFKSQAPAAAGKTLDRLVCFEDFAQTVLSLAGVTDVPAHMRGKPFLGPESGDEREWAFGHRDRVDEIIDLSRSVRGKRLLYIRNYMPHLPWNQQSAWIDQGEIRRDFYTLSDSNNATPAQKQYLGPGRPREELYDCKADPLNLNNLADSPKHKQTLEKMRAVLRDEIITSRDLGFVPEIEMRRIAKSTTPYEWAKNETDYELPRILNLAEQVGLPEFKQFAAALSDDNPSIRYWGAVGFSAADKLPTDYAEKLKARLADRSPIVRIEAANALMRHAIDKVALATLVDLLADDDLTTVLYAARTIELLGEKAKSAHAAMQATFDKYENVEGDPAWFVRFTISGFLSRVSP